jgi:mitochondrial import receptor subunit TOM70
MLTNEIESEMENKKEETSEELKEKGNEEYKKKNYKEAIKYYTEAIKIRETEILYSNR